MKKNAPPADSRDESSLAQKSIYPFVMHPERREVDPLRLMGKKEEIGQIIPPVGELVRLAAALAYGRTINQPVAEQLAKEVFELWNSCSQQRQKLIERQAYLEISRENDEAEKDGIPRPNKYPIAFDDFLRVLIGGKYVADRVKIYRRFAEWSIEGGHLWDQMYPRKGGGETVPFEVAVKRIQPVSLDEVESWMKDAKQRVYQTEDLYLIDARTFLHWRKYQSSELGRKAAKKRWSQARRHKKTRRN